MILYWLDWLMFNAQNVWLIIGWRTGQCPVIWTGFTQTAVWADVLYISGELSWCHTNVKWLILSANNVDRQISVMWHENCLIVSFVWHRCVFHVSSWTLIMCWNEFHSVYNTTEQTSHFCLVVVIILTYLKSQSELDF